MVDFEEEHVGESSSSQAKSKRQKQCHRHTIQQIQQLEGFFKQCPHPDENQRNQLGKDLGLDPKQIKFWFQNKRTQTKTHNERSDNNSLRAENERFHCENLAMKEALQNIICPKCDGPPIGQEERARNVANMKMENQRLREEHEKISNIISSVLGRSLLMNSRLGQSNSFDGSLLGQNICGSPFEYPSPPIHQENNHNSNNVGGHWININNTPIMSPSPQEIFELHHYDNWEKATPFKIILDAIDEVLELLQRNEPIWTKLSNDERFVIHRESYERTFPNPNRPYKSSTSRFESSKHSGVMPMTAIELMQNFLDPDKWMNMFPTIVAKAKTIEVLDSGHLGGSIQLMYEKLHILSPLVVAREFFFIRCCRQLDPTSWIMMDVSYDLFKEIESGVPSYSWKFPSGCLIQDIGNGQSMVSWIEHVQVDDKNQVNQIFGELLCVRHTYGAKRWIITLQRMSERHNFAMAATYPTRSELNGVVCDPQGLKHVMQLSQRMVKSFFEMLSMTEKLDYPSSSHLNNGDNISLRKNEEINQPKGFISTAATSLWLPLPFHTVFNFFKDDKTRPEWDVLSSGNDVDEVARVLTGTFPGNSITIIQPKENNMLLVLQESSIDEMGAFLVYSPMELPTVTSIINGGDATNVAILPSGIIMSPDGRLASDRDNTGNAQNGSILTLAFQILICDGDNSMSNQQHMDAVHSLLSSTVLKIKAALLL